MADITPSGGVSNGVASVHPVTRILWETLTSSNAAGSKISIPPVPTDMRVQVSGTFDSATVVMQGSSDGSAWVTLKDEDGNDVSLTAAGEAAIRSHSRFIRPSTSGGSGSQDVDVRLVIMRSGNL